jgi:hypothetical protein
MRRLGTFAAGAALWLLSAFVVQAQEKVCDDVVKIGMLEDMSSIYAEITGVGAVTAAKMAVEDFRRKSTGKTDRNRLSRSSKQAGYRLGHGAGMVR